MRTEPGQKQLALGQLAAVGAFGSQQTTSGGKVFAALLGQPQSGLLNKAKTGAVGDQAVGDGVAGIGFFQGAITSVRELGLPMDAPALELMAGARPDPDALPGQSTESRSEDEGAALVSLSVALLVPPPQTEGERSGNAGASGPVDAKLPKPSGLGSNAPPGSAPDPVDAPLGTIRVADATSPAAIPLAESENDLGIAAPSKEFWGGGNGEGSMSRRPEIDTPASGSWGGVVGAGTARTGDVVGPGVPVAPSAPTVPGLKSISSVPEGQPLQPKAAEDVSKAQASSLAGQTIDPAPGQLPDQNPESVSAEGDMGMAPRHLSGVTEAERMWLGRLLWQAIGASDAGDNPTENAATTPATEAEGAVPHSRTDRTPAATGVAAAPMPLPALQASEMVEQSPLLEADTAPFVLTLAAHLVPFGNPAAGPVPTVPVPVPQLAAGIIATLHQQADGTTEIALSPDELGSVRLRLEADARDPDRMIVHLAFDRPETMDLFRRHADQLADAIRSAGYAEAKLDFGQSGTGLEAGGGHGPEGRSDGGGATPAANDPDWGPDPLVQDKAFPLRPGDTAGLDLRL